MTAGDPEQRIAELEAEIARLKAALDERIGMMLTISDMTESSLAPTSFTIHGLEEQVILVNERGRIDYANRGMAKLLGAEDKSLLLRQPLASWDQGKLGQGFFAALVMATRASGKTNIIERQLADSGEASKETQAPAKTILRVIAHPVNGKVQIVVQDVTRLRWLEQTFSRYVAPPVISQLMALKPDELLQVEQRMVTVLFTDLRGFTRLCQQLPADEICAMLNEHFELVVRIVDAQEGTVDKLIGDSVMAVFGAPLATPDFALRALATAVEVRQAHEKWLAARQARRQPAAGIGIGLATGHVVVGNVGTPKRMDYTVLGHTVNIADRLCHAAKEGEIYTEQETYTEARRQYEQHGGGIELPHVRFEPKGKLRLRNVAEPLEVLRVSSADAAV